MTMKLKLLSVILIVTLLFTSCDGLTQLALTSSEETSSVMSEEEILRLDYEKTPEKYVFFQNYTPEKKLYLTVDEITAYQTQYPECNSTWFRDKLSGDDLNIYNAFMYALENQFTYFSLYVSDGEKDYSYIRECLSLDSPFIAQNVDRDNEYFYPTHVDNGKEKFAVRMDNFSLGDWQNNMQALNKCKEIVASIPEEYQTQEEKMRYLFKYVRDHIDYKLYENRYNVNYLYDAVMRGETLCDGYSNMLLLLFNLIGVECCEAMGDNILDYSTATEEELENANGHTWVVAKLGDTFYNFDPTFEDSADYTYIDSLQYFGFSDELVSIKYFDCEELRPKCEDTSRDYSYADMVVDSITDHPTVEEIARYTNQNIHDGKSQTIILVNKVVDDNEYDHFFDIYWRYTTFVSNININYYTMEDKTLIIMKVK